MEPVLIVWIVRIVWIAWVVCGIYIIINFRRNNAFLKYLEEQMDALDWNTQDIDVYSSFDNLGRSSIFDNNFEKMVVRKCR